MLLFEFTVYKADKMLRLIFMKSIILPTTLICHCEVKGGHRQWAYICKMQLEAFACWYDLYFVVISAQEYKLAIFQYILIVWFSRHDIQVVIYIV